MPLARHRLTAALLVVCTPLVVGAGAGQALRVAGDARQIRDFRLADTHLVKLRHVAATLARGYTPSPERPRADAAMFVVLSMSLAFNEPFSDRTVAEMTRTIEAGHPDLLAAITAAGSTPAEFVLTHITLLLAFPVVVSERAGRAKLPSTDTAEENVDFVRRNWADVQAILDEIGAAAGLSKP